jgi:hypothetical protein
VKALRNVYQDPEYVEVINKLSRIDMFYQLPEEMPGTVKDYWKDVSKQEDFGVDRLNVIHENALINGIQTQKLD